MSDCARITENISDVFKDRVVSLIGYGSSINKRATTTSDLDLFLLLDRHLDGDERLCREITSNHGDANVDLSLQYNNELPRNPAFFQDGSKGCLALAYLSSAQLLIGRNVFRAMYSALPEADLKVSIAQTVRRYYLMMGNDARDPGSLAIARHQRLKKYMSRSLIDAMIFFKKTDMEPYKHLTHDAVFDLAASHEQIHPFAEGLIGQGEILSKLGSLVLFLEDRVETD